MRRGNAILAVVASVALVGMSIAILMLGRPSTDASAASITMYCAAGIKPAVEPIARAFENETGIAVRLEYGGSGTLLSRIKVNPEGDLYLAADESYIRDARIEGLVRESIPLARMHPVIAVRSGNPKGITAVTDLLREDVTVALANPDAAAIGRLTRKRLTDEGLWTVLEAHCKVFKPTVNDVANDILLGAVDAGVIWDATAAQYDEIDAIDVPVFEPATRRITVGVLDASTEPTSALRFARYLGARDRGQRTFATQGYVPVDGDVWAMTPTALLMAGSMFNQAVEETITEFEAREGCRINRVYNGCGILTAQMRAGERPDAYFSCDTVFMESVADLFVDEAALSSNPMVLITRKGNPDAIEDIHDLANPGLKVGLAHPEKSALGHLTAMHLESHEALEPLQASGNWVVDAPQGDFLVNQLRAGALDAAIVYASNAANIRDHAEVILLDAVARQPIAIGAKTDHHHLMSRLLDAIRTRTSKDRFTALGFEWLAEEG